MDYTFSQDDDTIYYTNGKNDNKTEKKKLSDELIQENDSYMDDIIASGLYKY